MSESVKNPKAMVDFGCLKGLISSNPKFMVSDIDGVAERNGRFLALEIKTPNDTLSEGCSRMLKSLSSIPQFMCVLANVTGNRSSTGGILFEPTSIHRITKDGLSVVEDCNLEQFEEKYIKWYNRVNNIR